MKKIIAVDGPSGVGKGTLCYRLAEKLSFKLLDSGAVYRILALAAVKNNVDLANEDELTNLCRNIDIKFIPENGEVNVILNGESVGDEIRTAQAGINASLVAKFPKVRTALLEMQRAFATEQGLVADGRDMGTVVFKEAQCKIFLDATAKARAERRVKQLQEKGFNADYETILKDIEERDDRDRNRVVAPLKAADDAIIIDTSSLGINEVFDKALEIIARKGMM